MTSSIPVTLSYHKLNDIANDEDESNSDNSTDVCLSSIKIENESVTDLKQSHVLADNDTILGYTDATEVGHLVEEDGIFEETIQLNERHNTNKKSINKLTVQSSFDMPGFNLKDKEISGGITDIECLIASDEDLSTEEKMDENYALNCICDGSGCTDISDNIKRNDCLSPLVTPEPQKKNMIKKKCFKLSKSFGSKLSPLKPSLQNDMQCTDVEYLISDSESDEIKYCNKVQLSSSKDGWLTDTEDLSLSSDDESGIQSCGLKATSSDLSFCKDFESGSEEELSRRKNLNKKPKIGARKKSQPKIIIRQTSEDHNLFRRTKFNSSFVHGKRHLCCSKHTGDSSKIMCRNSLKHFENCQIYEETNLHQTDGDCYAKSSKHKPSFIKNVHSKKLSSDFRNEHLMFSKQKCPACVAVQHKHPYAISELTDSESVYSDNSDYLSDKGRFYENKNSVSKQIIKKINKPFAYDHNLDLNKPKIFQRFKDNKQIDIIQGNNDPLTDVEEILLPNEKTYLAGNLKGNISESGITDTEEIELTDNELIKTDKYEKTQLENVNTTDVDEFSAPEDCEELVEQKISETIPFIDYFTSIHSDSVTTDKEGISSQYSSESKNQFESDVTVPLIKTISPSPTFQNTDSEDMIESAEEAGYSGNVTPTMADSKIDFEDSSSVVLMKSTRTFHVEAEEYLHVKDATENYEPLTDVEDLSTQDEIQSSVQSVAHLINNMKIGNILHANVPQTKTNQEDEQDSLATTTEQGEQSHDTRETKKSECTRKEALGTQCQGEQKVVRPPLKYDISMDDETECDPREHDWRFYLQPHLEGDENQQDFGEGSTQDSIRKQSDISTSKKT